MIYIFITILLLVLSASFSASETAIFWLPTYKVNTLAKKGKRGKILYKLYNSPNYTLPLILLCNTLVNVLLSIISLQTVEKIFGLSELAQGIALIINIVLITSLLLIFGEFGPKLFSIRKAEEVSLFFSPFIYILGILLYPIVFPFEKLISFILKDKKKDILSSSEILWMFYKGRLMNKVLKGSLWKIAHSLLILDQTPVEDIMTPRRELISVDSRTTWREVKDLFLKKNISKIIVYKEIIDQVIGILDLSECLADNPQPDTKVFNLMSQTYFLPTTTKLTKLINELQKSDKSTFLIKDEYGGTSGIITMEDIFWFFAGSKLPVYDDKQQTKESESLIVNADMSLDIISEATGIYFKHKQLEESLNKFILRKIGFIPSKGYLFEYKNYEFEILNIRKNTILKVKITRKQI